jgi:hypothetical protein
MSLWMDFTIYLTIHKLILEVTSGNGLRERIPIFFLEKSILLTKIGREVHSNPQIIKTCVV